VKKIASAFVHPLTMINMLFVGTLGVIQLVHTRAHYTLDQDVHSHVTLAIKKNPELARSACWELD